MFKITLSPEIKNVLNKIAPLVCERNFYLAGGTGLALQIGHRVSDDLDFFRSAPFDEIILLADLRKVDQNFKEILVEKHTISAFIEDVRCSFFYYEVSLIFSPLKFEGIDIASWQDILAEKFKTLSQRGSKKDFFDIFYTIKMKNLTIDESISYFKKRFEKTGINPYHVLRSLTYFEDAETEPDPIFLSSHTYTWEEVKAFFIDNIKEFGRNIMV